MTNHLAAELRHCELPQGHPLPHREGEMVWQPMEPSERNSLVDHDTNHREPVADCEWCPRLPEPVTPPAQPAHDAPAGDDGHPGTPDGPAALQRAEGTGADDALAAAVDALGDPQQPLGPASAPTTAGAGSLQVAAPIPEPSPLDTTDCPRHTTWRDCAVAGCPPPQEPGLADLTDAERDAFVALAEGREPASDYQERMESDLAAAEVRADRAEARCIELKAELQWARQAEPGPERDGTMLTVPDSPKMIRETLCVAQMAVGQVDLGDSGRRHIAQLGRLIDECDRHRPLGPDGKHGKRHTATCGCDPAQSILGGEALLEDPYATWDPSRATDDPDGLPDRAIVPLVEELRERGIVTLQSCIGHLEEQADGSRFGRDGTLWVHADSVDGARIRLFLLGQPFDRVQLVSWPEHRWEFSWHPDDADAAVGALAGLLPAATGPAPESAGDGPGWQREAIRAVISALAAGGPVERARANQLRSLLADRDGMRDAVVVLTRELGTAVEETKSAERNAAYWARVAGDRAQERDAARRSEADWMARAEWAEERVDGQAWVDLEAERDQLRAQLVDAGQANRLWAGDHADLQAQLEAMTADRDQLAVQRDRYREHSVTLNSVGWKLAEALGDVPDGAETVRGNPLEQVERLIAELQRLRGELDEMQQRWKQATEDGDDQTVTRLRLHRELREARAEVDQTRLQAAEARTVADSLADQLATARREGAADALDNAARYIRRVWPDLDPEVAKVLEALAAATRTGHREVPTSGQPEPAPSESEAS